jgi:hypothetical protein
MVDWKKFVVYKYINADTGKTRKISAENGQKYAMYAKVLLFWVTWRAKNMQFPT